MPDQNNPTDANLNPPQVTPPGEPGQLPTPPVSDVPPPTPMDIPPADASLPPPFPPDAGSAAPNFDIPPVITPGQPNKKFGGKRVIATILGLLVLVGGLGAGVILVRQQQDIRERAAGPVQTYCSAANQANCPNGCTPSASGGVCKPYCSSANNRDCTFGCTPNNSGGTCKSAPAPAPTPYCSTNNNRDCTFGCTPNNSGGTCKSAPVPTGGISCTIVSRDPLSQGYCDRSAPNTPDCTDKDEEGSSCTIRSQCGGGTGTCVVINQGGANSECQCQKGAAPPPPTKTPTPPPPPGEPTAQCLNIKAYDTNWTELTSAQLAQIKVGDTVRFTVAGQASSGSFDKARFKINGVQRPEVTGKRPATEEYYDEYTIPAGITTFTINAQIHHATLGWSL